MIGELIYKYGLSEDDAIFAVRVSRKLGVSPDKVVRTSYILLMELLCDKIEEKEKVIDTISEYLERMK